MENRTEGAGVVLAIGLILFLLLTAGVAGFYLFMGRQSVASQRQVERARMAEEEARLQAELARVEAEAAASRCISPEAAPPAVPSDLIRAEVELVLRTQAAAWNRGDLDAFMEHYAKSETPASESLTFSSGGKTTRGWNETLKRYRERYPTPEKMGRVEFNDLEITPLGDSAALVLGRWRVDRKSEPISGNFSLVLRKLGGHWRIIHDHTSRLTE